MIVRYFVYDRGAVRAAAHALENSRARVTRHPAEPGPVYVRLMSLLSEHRMCGTGELSTHKRYRKESFEHHTGYSVTVLTPDSRGRSLWAVARHGLSF